MLETTTLASREASPQSLLLHLCMHHGALAATAAEKDAFAVPVLPQKLWIREPFVPADVRHKSVVLSNTPGHLCLKQGVVVQ